MPNSFSLALSTLLLILLLVFIWSVTVFSSGYNIPPEEINSSKLIRNLLFSLSAFLLLCVTAWLPIRRPIVIKLMLGFGLLFLGACQELLGTLVSHVWLVTRWLDMLAMPAGLGVAALGMYEFGKAYRLNRLMIGSYRKIEESLATVDQITQLPNRRVFLDDAPRRLRPGSNLVSDELIRVGVTNLQVINREHGFTNGDAVLSHIARQITRLIHHPALAARMSGSVFYILLPETSRKAAEALAQNLLDQTRIHAINGKSGESQLVKISLQATYSTREGNETLEQWLHRIASGQ